MVGKKINPWPSLFNTYMSDSFCFYMKLSVLIFIIERAQFVNVSRSRYDPFRLIKQIHQ